MNVTDNPKQKEKEALSKLLEVLRKDFDAKTYGALSSTLALMIAKEPRTALCKFARMSDATRQYMEAVGIEPEWPSVP